MSEEDPYGEVAWNKLQAYIGQNFLQTEHYYWVIRFREPVVARFTGEHWVFSDDAVFTEDDTEIVVIAHVQEPEAVKAMKKWPI